MAKLNFDVEIESLPCPVCHNKLKVRVHIKDKVNAAKYNLNVEDAYPYLHPGIRERFKTGLCGITCWEKYLGIA